MVFQSTFASVNLSVTVQILELDVARAVNEVIGLYTGLVSNACFVNPLAAGVLSVKVILGEITLGFEAPDVAPGLTFIRILNVVCTSDILAAALPLGHFNLRVADREVCIRCQILGKLMTPCQRELPSA